MTTVEGMTFDLDLSEMIDALIYLREYERDVVSAIERLCRPGMCVLDIGANMGVHTLRLAKIVGETGKVIAFEPTSYAYDKLIKNISLNSFRNITALQIALFDRNLDGQVVDMRSSWRTGGGRMDKPGGVSFRRLDGMCAARALDRVDLVKLDVDGNEMAVLEGATETVQQNKPAIIMEVGPYHFRNEESNPLLKLHALGYWFYEAASGKPFPSLETIMKECRNVDSINLIALPS